MDKGANNLMARLKYNEALNVYSLVEARRCRKIFHIRKFSTSESFPLIRYKEGERYEM